MADLNVVYAATTDSENPDIVLAKVCDGVEFLGACIGGKFKELHLPDPVREQMRKLNADAISTADAVKVPYTTGDRKAWLQSTIKAVDNRVEFIRQRTNQLLLRIKGNDVAYQAATKLIEAGLALVPGIGSTISYIAGEQSKAEAVDAAMTQALLQNYANDLKQLADIRAQLMKEYTGGTGLTGLISNAATPIPTYYYYIAGAIVLLLLLMIIRNRNRG